MVVIAISICQLSFIQNDRVDRSSISFLLISHTILSIMSMHEQFYEKYETELLKSIQFISGSAEQILTIDSVFIL